MSLVDEPFKSLGEQGPQSSFSWLCRAKAVRCEVGSFNRAARVEVIPCGSKGVAQCEPW